MKKNCCLIICIFIVTYGFSQILKTSIVSIKPDKPKVGEVIYVTVQYVSSQNEEKAIYSYNYRNSDIVEFVSVQHKKTRGDIVEMQISFYVKRPGIIRLPPIVQSMVSDTISSSRSVIFPDIYIYSLLSEQLLEMIKDKGEPMFPMKGALYFILFLINNILLVVLFCIFIYKIRKKQYIKKMIVLYGNRYNVRLCEEKVMKVYTISKKMSQPNFKRPPINTRKCYKQLIVAIRERMLFLFGEEVISFTHDEMRDVIHKRIFHGPTQELFEPIMGFFNVLDKVLYGNEKQDQNVRIYHCGVVLEVLKKSRRVAVKNDSKVGENK